MPEIIWDVNTVTPDSVDETSGSAYQSGMEAPLSENNEKPTPAACEPVVFFNGGPVRLLMLMYGTHAEKEPIFQVILGKPDGLEGAPPGAIRLADLALLHQLTGEALRQAIAATSIILSPKATPPTAE